MSLTTAHQSMLLKELKKIVSFNEMWSIKKSLIIWNIFTKMMIKNFFGIVQANIIFMILYMQLRSNEGRCHAKTQLRCYFIYNNCNSLNAVRSLDILGQFGDCNSMLIIYALEPVKDKNIGLLILWKQQYIELE